MRVSVATMSRAVRKLGWSFIKDDWESLSETKRNAFRLYMRSMYPRRFVLLDKCSTSIVLTRLSRVPRGKRAHGKAPRNRSKNIILIGAIGADRVKPSMSVERATDGLAFETNIEHFLAPTLEAGQIIVVDNLLVHKSRRVKELIEGAGAELLFLPLYSPDFHPIE